MHIKSMLCFRPANTNINAAGGHHRLIPHKKTWPVKKAEIARLGVVSAGNTQSISARKRLDLNNFITFFGCKQFAPDSKAIGCKSMFSYSELA